MLIPTKPRHLLTLLDLAEGTYAAGPSTADDVIIEESAWRVARVPSVGADFPDDGNPGEPSYGVSVASDVELPPPVNGLRRLGGPSVGADFPDDLGQDAD
jgi:hypothetical protein